MSDVHHGTCNFRDASCGIEIEHEAGASSPVLDGIPVTITNLAE